MLDLLFLFVPAVFCVVSVLIAVKAFEKGASAKKTVLIQLASFCAVFAVCLICPIVANAAAADPSAVAATEATAATVATAAATISEAATVAAANSAGMGYIGAGIATGLSCIGGGIAVGNAAPAAIGATSEDPKNFGKSIIFVALGEGCALYGMLISIMIISKI